MSEVIKLPPSLLNSAEGQQTLTVQDCTAAATSADHTRTQNHVFYLSQAKYWNPSVNEVEGVITDRKGNVIHKLFGKWHEAVYCGKPPSATCVWRASTTVFFINASMQSLCSMVRVFFPVCLCHAEAMPVDHEQHYGFTKFAIELNELDPSLKPLLPPTDTRLRLDQR